MIELTPNYMDDDEIREALAPILRGILIKRVKLTFYPRTPKSNKYLESLVNMVYMRCPVIEDLEGMGDYFAVPIVSVDGHNYFVTYEILRDMEIPKTEVLWHAKKRTEEILDKLILEGSKGNGADPS